MGKGGKAHRSGGLGKSKLLSSVGSSAGPQKSKASLTPKAGAAKKERTRELDAEFGSLRERVAAKKFRKAPAPNVVLAAPIFSLPTEQERLLEPFEHPLDQLLLGEGGLDCDIDDKLKKRPPAPMPSTSMVSISLQPSIFRADNKYDDEDCDI